MADQSQHAFEATKGSPGLGPVALGLRRLRSAARRSLLLRGLAWLAASVAAWLIAAIVLDYLLRMPVWLRTAILVAGLAGLVVAVRRWLGPAWRFTPSLTEIALRVERTPEARKAGLAGLLASGLELAGVSTAGSAGRWLSQRVVDEAGQRARALRSGTVLRRGLVRDSLLTLLTVVVLCGGLAWTSGTELTGIGLRRVLTPWSGAAWPKRTIIAHASSLAVHPLGTALPLRAAVLRTDQAPGRTRVEAKYRLVAGGQTGPLQRTVLPGQGRPVMVQRSGEAAALGELYERLIEPTALAPADLPGGEAAELEYWFESEDDRTSTQRILLVHPPTVAQAEATVTLPAYAAGPAHAHGFIAGDVEMGPGNDRRAVVGPVLVGSHIDLRITLSKPVPAPPSRNTDPEGHAGWLADVLPGAEFGDDLRATFAGSSWHLAWTLRRTARLPVVPVDRHGLASPDEAVYAFEAVEDRIPAAVVTRPEQDEAVLATALVEATGEGRDDVAVASVALEAQAARRATGSMGAAPEPAGEPRGLARRDLEGGMPVTQATVTTSVDLSQYDLRPGDELWLTALAADGFELEGRMHEPVRSSARKLRVISEDEFVEQIRGELQRIRDAAIRLDGEQEELARAVGRGLVTDDDRRRQAGLSQRIEQQGQIAERLADRTERNRLGDDALGGMLEDVGALLQGARRSSEQAATRLDEAAQRSRDELGRTALTPEEGETAQQAQARVRDDLGRLIEMLDRGRDSWVVRRELQRLLEQQRSLQAQTRNVGEGTTGREVGDLSPQERADLERIAEQQLDLARRAQEALDGLAERARQMRDVDAAQSSAMEQAAQRGRSQRVPERMEQAGQSASQNQTGTAQQQQQDAIEAMERMLSDLDNAERNRDESLRRLLVSLIESLDGLIRQQQAELEALAGAEERGVYRGLDAGMIRLNQNTLGVLGEARSAFREMARVAQYIETAADAQAEAIVRLRRDPVEPGTVRDSEEESLRALQQARAEAERLQQEARKRDQARKRQELRKVYREALELQVVLRDDTAPLVGQDLDRRQRMTVRTLGERQEAIRTMLADLRKRTDELADAAVFDMAHQQLDSVAGSAAKKLRAGQSPSSVGREQNAAVRILQALVEALSETAGNDDSFRDQQGGGAGGTGGESPLIPELAELRLLRGLQVQAAEFTRALEESTEGAAPGEVEELGRLQSELAERGEELIRKMQRPAGPPGDRPAGGGAP